VARLMMLVVSFENNKRNMLAKKCWRNNAGEICWLVDHVIMMPIQRLCKTANVQ